MGSLTFEGLVQALKDQVNNGDITAAVATARQAVVLAPAQETGWFLLGATLQLSGLPDDALAAYRQALALLPASAALQPAIELLAHNGDYPSIIPLLKNRLQVHPEDTYSWVNLCLYLHKAGYTQLAIAAGQMAIRLDATLPQAHWNLAQSLLRAGDLQEGWAAYESRRQLPQFAVNQVELSLPYWSGQPFPGQTLLVVCEQGAGDTFQFIRYLPHVKRLGGKVILAADRPLLPLLAQAAGVDQLVAREDMLQVAEAADQYVFLLSLPHVLQCPFLPMSTPYLAPPPGRYDRLAPALQTGITPVHMRVGLVWAGNPGHGNDRHRSMALADFAPLAGLEGVQFYSLQKGPAAAGGQAWPDGLPLVDLAPLLRDYADTAAAINCLDLLISVDTSVAHLAGALGKPVWTLLPRLDVDWRWQDGRESSAWYPGMRLFQQPADRAAFMCQLAGLLRQVCPGHSARPPA